MINENEKVYIICEQCANTEECEYYQNVIDTVKVFIETPLNMHFPKCRKYESKFTRLFKEIENMDIVPFCDLNKLELHKDEYVVIFKKALEIHFKDIEERE